MAKRTKPRALRKAPAAEKTTYSLLIRDVPLTMKPRLEAARARMGFRSVNETVMALLNEVLS